MIGDISGATNIYIITGYTDMRKSLDGLYAIVVSQLNEEPNEHSIYLFCGKRCDRIKILLREPDGYVLLYKRLNVKQGRYRWPRNRSEVQPITWQQFDLCGSLCRNRSSCSGRGRMDDTGILKRLSGDKFYCREHFTGGMSGGRRFHLSAFLTSV